MSLFDKIFGPRKQQLEAVHAFETLTAYRPAFRTWRGAIYENEFVRAAIDAKARHISKLGIKIDGAAKPKVQTMLKKRPNAYQTWSQFFYRLATILEMQNTVFIVPIISREGDVVGLWTALPSECSLLEDKNGVEWLRYRFRTGDVGAVRLSQCGVMTKFQYVSDFFGSDNKALDDTLDLISLERQGIKEAIKSSASFRFMARSTNFKSPEDLSAEQKNFTEQNLKEDSSGFLLFPNTYDSIQRIKSDPYSVPVEEVKLIKENVHSYFGVNDDIVMNKATGDKLDGFFDGAIEPFAIQCSEVLTFMLFTDTEIAYGARVHVTANRLQYMSTGDKINFIAQLSDRGFITINEGRELLNYTPIEGGDRLPIRGEYYFVGEDKEPAEGEDNGNQE
jgi:hypothetical protein